MGNPRFSPIFAILLLLSFSTTSPVLSGDVRRYIVAVRRPESAENSLEDYYKSFLPQSTSADSTSVGSRLVYVYEHVFSGFSARLTPEELQNHVATKEGFLRAYPDRTVPLLTTHTPDFLGLQLGRGLWSEQEGNQGQGVIIGVIDSGFTPGHPSFDDRGMPPPPPKWRGSCLKDTCNNKVIGAMSFQDVGATSVDDEGHGTQTASTAAGSFVPGASVLGNANGTASGIASRSHLAVYKVCNALKCSLSDIVAAMDAAVKDGVDVLSMSLGSESLPYSDDPLAIGAMAAVEKGIPVSIAGGNDGPAMYSIANEAPWMLTVGASSHDRSIRVTIKLSSGQEVLGVSLIQPKNFPSTPLELTMEEGEDSTYPKDLGDVRGKLVVCSVSSPEIVARLKAAGAAGAILFTAERYGTTVVENFVPDLHTVRTTFADGRTILEYIKSSGAAAKALLVFHGTELGVYPAPMVSGFSSRGPGLQNEHILKPDIIGPGLNVLAAWPPNIYKGLQEPLLFNMESGTSMAAPHLAGVIALLKAAHPDWSPAAIKSAIMTTSDDTDHEKKPLLNQLLQPASFHEMGAGHVNPTRAANPGLVYDTNPESYIPFLCGLKYTNQQVGVITGRKVDCAVTGKIQQWDLNYPSISIFLPLKESVALNRTVINVGPVGKISYTALVDKMPGVTITVTPRTLEFSEVKQERSFTVVFERSGYGDSGNAPNFVEGNLRWISGEYVVRSPIHVDLIDTDSMGHKA